MARKTATVRIAGGRDAGKSFFITEMSASRAESWGLRAVGGMLRAGIALEDGILSLGMGAVARVGVSAFFKMQAAEAEPLLEELMACVQIQPDPSKTFYRSLIEDDVEDALTRVRLKSEVLELHTGFSVAGALLAWGMAAPATVEDTETTEMSPPPSAESSPPASPPSTS